jgi:hypothetical protein
LLNRVGPLERLGGLIVVGNEVSDGLRQHHRGWRNDWAAGVCVAAN